ncbi:lipopolysaccharide biosynthesis protein, partial [Chloroflexota bacterium]
MNVGQKVVRGIIYNATGNIYVQFIGLIIAIIIARTLGPELQGIYVLILSIPATINTFITLGWNQGLNRYIPALRGENKEGLIRPILHRIFALRFGLSIGAILLLFLFSGLIEDLFDIEGWLDWQILTLISGYLLISNLGSILTMILTVDYQQKWLAIFNALATSCMLLAILGLLYFELMHVKNILFIVVIIEIIRLVLLVGVYKRNTTLPLNYDKGELAGYIRRFAKFS